jgi:hypothetical protein
VIPGGEDVRDAGRDALALIRACASGDDEGAAAILDHASLRDVAQVLAGMAAGLLTDRAALMGWTGDVTELLGQALRSAAAAGQDSPGGG